MGSGINVGKNELPKGFSKGNGKKLIKLLNSQLSSEFDDLIPYRYIRFFHSVASGNAKCWVAEAKLRGH